MKEKLKRPGYEAPKMEATSFKVEQGYAGSVTASSMTITMTGGSL